LFSKSLPLVGGNELFTPATRALVPRSSLYGGSQLPLLLLSLAFGLIPPQPFLLSVSLFSFPASAVAGHFFFPTGFSGLYFMCGRFCFFSRILLGCCYVFRFPNFYLRAGPASGNGPILFFPGLLTRSLSFSYHFFWGVFYPF